MPNLTFQALNLYHSMGYFFFLCVYVWGGARGGGGWGEGRRGWGGCRGGGGDETVLIVVQLL